jgi:hypothetical protein
MLGVFAKDYPRRIVEGSWKVDAEGGSIQVRATLNGSA